MLSYRKAQKDVGSCSICKFAGKSEFRQMHCLPHAKPRRKIHTSGNSNNTVHVAQGQTEDLLEYRTTKDTALVLNSSHPIDHSHVMTNIVPVSYIEVTVSRLKIKIVVLGELVTGTHFLILL